MLKLVARQSTISLIDGEHPHVEDQHQCHDSYVGKLLFLIWPLKHITKLLPANIAHFICTGS